MPAPTNPPYSAGATVQPRQLNRWLDVNKVSRLTRAQTYLTVPAFNVASNWRGYSELVAVFNYTTTNNFSIKLVNTAFPSSPNYLACIVWVDSSYNVHRYKLWENTEIIYQDVPVYTNQQIKKNFRIEIWTVEPSSYSFDLTGAGTAVVNGTYNVVAPNIWSNGVCSVTKTGLNWQCVNINTLDQYYLNSSILEDRPYNPWTLDVNGTNPVPTTFTDATVTQSTSFDIYTSVLQAYDYRYVDDDLLAPTPTILTALSNVLPLVLPATFPANSSPTLN